MKVNKALYQVKLEITSYINHAYDTDVENHNKPVEKKVTIDTVLERFESEESARRFYEVERTTKFDPKKHWLGYEYKVLSIREVSAPFFYKVGDGIHYCGYSDAYSYTVIEVSKNGKKIKVQRDSCKQTEKLKFTPGGFVGHFDDACQKWVIQPNPNGEIVEVSLRKNGRWMGKGASASQHGGGYLPGHYEHYDYNF